MTTILIRGAVLALIAYLAFAVLFYAMQDRFIFPAPQTRFEPVSGFEAVTLTTEDGLELSAHWQAPQEGKPSVVWFHGNAGTLKGAVAETAFLANLGYGVLLVEYRGYGGNPGQPSEEGFYRDGRAAMAFLQEAGVTPERTIIAGNSIGSGTAVELAGAYSPAALILVAPFTSLPDVAAEAMSLLPARALVQHRFDNLSKVEKLKLPMLVLHGTGDKVVPFAHGQELVKAGSRATFEPFEGVGHDLSFQIKAQQVQADWLARQGL